MLQSAAMSDPSRKQDTTIRSLVDLFGNVFHIDVIRSVAFECDFDIHKSSNILLEMSNNQPQQNRRKSPKRSPPKKVDASRAPPKVVKSRKTLELERVVGNIRQGYKVLILLRGLPGSGKSRMAVVITDVTLGPGNNSRHILSTDDFFIQEGGYVFNPTKLHEAHAWNHTRAFQAMSRGLSPVIIDNTHTQMWEMKPYATMAVDYGYFIEILEPDTWWAFDEKELARRNTHHVPKTKIKEMLDRYERNVTNVKLLNTYNLSYKFQKPPQFRLIPPITQQSANENKCNAQAYRLNCENIVKSKSTSAIDENCINLMEFNDVTQNGLEDNRDLSSTDPIDEILMCTEDNTCETLQPTVETKRSRIVDFRAIENAWGVNTKALQGWDCVSPITDIAVQRCESIHEEVSKVETVDSATNVEADDVSKGRILETHSRDINVGTPIKVPAPPKKTMIDQSSSTDDFDEVDRFHDLTDMFPKLARSYLAELYERCNKNFHWTVDLVLEDNLEVCEEIKEEEEVVVVDSDEEARPQEKKNPRRKNISQESLELKKCLESKIEIDRSHYSDHVARIKQTRFGAYSEPQPSTSSRCEEVSTSYQCDSDSDESEEMEDPKNMIELNLGENFVAQLETTFGVVHGFPQGYQPVVQMPIDIARQIYSFYIESVCQQMEAQNHILDSLIKEDEDFARRLQLQEELLLEDYTPNLAQIMNEQAALNVHRRESEEWKNLTVDNLATKLTKQKLLQSFPNVDPTALLEIWHAYDYDYQKTVEDLIDSVGPQSIQFSETIKEPPITQTLLDEMKLAESDCIDIDETEDKPATFYREQANKHLQKRADLYEKAKQYQHRKMTEVARFYSELAQKETKFYDKANNLAAAAFMDEHSNRLQKFDTLDLHYFYVKEAIPNLDIFIDRNINLLRGSTKRGQDLFVITGRGKNSVGGLSKIKPAVISRLKTRKIGFVQLNPGLLKIRVQRDTLVTSDLTQC